MNENTIKERQTTGIGTGVQMSKYLHHNSFFAGQKHSIWYIDGLVQDCSISSALAMGIL